MLKKIENLQNFLKAARESKGLSQKAVAEKLGYSTPQFVSNWERGLSCPPLKIVKKLSEIYNVDPEELFEVILETKVQEMRSGLQKTFRKRA